MANIKSFKCGIYMRYTSLNILVSLRNQSPFITDSLLVVLAHGHFLKMPQHKLHSSHSFIFSLYKEVILWS